MNILVAIWKDGRQTNFERFSYKRLSTVLNRYRKAYNGGHYTGLWYNFFRDYEQADRIVVYSTPDHYNRGNIIAEYTGPEFIAAIG